MSTALKVYRNRVESSIGSICSEVRNIIGFVQGIYGSVDDNTYFDLKVILNELLLNSIKHGNKNNPDKFIRITAAVRKGCFLYIIVEDEGEGFDFESLLKANKSVAEFPYICSVRETGRGILIVDALSDSIKLNKKGNKIMVAKRLSPGPVK